MQPHFLPIILGQRTSLCLHNLLFQHTLFHPQNPKTKQAGCVETPEKEKSNPGTEPG